MNFLKLFKKKNINNITKSNDDLKKDLEYILHKQKSLIYDLNSVVGSDYFFDTKDNFKKYLNDHPNSLISIKRKVLHLNQTILDIFEKNNSLEKMVTDFLSLYTNNKKLLKLNDYKSLEKNKQNIESKLILLRKYKRISNFVFRQE
jgi:hypothetical protein